MLIRLEVLSELRRVGIKEPSLLKKYLEDFEHYMKINHGLKIAAAGADAEDGKFRREVFEKISPLFK